MASLDSWHPIRLTDHTVIDHINDYLSDGWYLEHFDLDGLPYPIFNVPAELIPPGKRRMEELMDLGKRGQEPINLIVLRHGANGIRQRATLLELNAEGKAVKPVPLQGWKSIATLKFEDGRWLNISQREIGR